jgi:hypothetical protein
VTALNIEGQFEARASRTAFMEKVTTFSRIMTGSGVRRNGALLKASTHEPPGA